MSNKDKKTIAKRNAKALERKRQKRKLHLVKTKQHQASHPPNYDRAPMSEVDAPPGFQAIPTTQAILAYSKSLMEWNKSSSIDDLNQVMQFVMHIWNYGIAVEQGDVSSELKESTCKMVELLYEVDSVKAQDLLEQFVARKKELFPPEVQIPGSRYMFMRKEISRIIAPFNYGQLNITEDVPPIDSGDQEFIARLQKMDDAISAGTKYSEWEDDYLDLEKLCQKSFSNWLLKKGVNDNLAQEFPFHIQVFMNFVYRYAHKDEFVLESIGPMYFEEFLFDHVLRKVMLEPHEHVLWPPTLKIFYQFLAEKDYLENHEPYVCVIDDLERQFLDVLRERFG